MQSVGSVKLMDSRKICRLYSMAISFSKTSQERQQTVSANPEAQNQNVTKSPAMRTTTCHQVTDVSDFELSTGSTKNSDSQFTESKTDDTPIFLFSSKHSSVRWNPFSVRSYLSSSFLAKMDRMASMNVFRQKMSKLAWAYFWSI